MERVLSSLFAGSRVWSRSLRAYPRRRRRRSICPISAVARLGCTPSAAYPLSPRRREIFRPPLLDRAGADVNVIRSTIYSGSSVPTNIARKERRQEKGIRRMPPLRVTAIHDGVVAVAGVGVILRSHHVTGKQARQNLSFTVLPMPSRPNTFATKHFRYKTLSLSQSLRGGGNSLGQRGTSAVQTVALPGSP